MRRLAAWVLGLVGRAARLAPGSDGHLARPPGPTEAEAAERFGRSWLRLRDDPRRPLHTFIVARSAHWTSGCEVDALLGILVDDRHKLVAGLEDELFELSDLASDPRERVDRRRRMWRQLALAWDVDHPDGR